MMRSMFSGVSGLRTHQTMMDVVGNNIANVNTAGFKSSQVTFAEAISQTVRGASAPTADRGGVNPAGIGLGVRVASIDGVFTQGASQVTGRNTDLAIQGDGFFILDTGGERAYTRSGSFVFDAAGSLTGTGGALVQGWAADQSGAIDANRPVGSIRIPLGQVVDPVGTSLVELGGSLSADTVVGGTAVSSISVFDSLGNEHEVQFTFTKVGANDWTLAVEIDAAPVTIAPSTVQFDTTGQLVTATPLAVTGFTPAGADPLNFDVELGGDLAIVQFGGGSTMEALNKNGSAIGSLTGYSVGNDGSIAGQFSNGQTKMLGQVATATFANPAGLTRSGASNFASSVDSGEPLVGTAGSGNRGLLSAGTLEMSNVDLAREFTNLIIAQRGFQANSRVITTSDEMLSDLVNLKR
jgi:flagellar hook protein FlgE